MLKGSLLAFQHRRLLPWVQIFTGTAQLGSIFEHTSTVAPGILHVVGGIEEGTRCMLLAVWEWSV